MKLWRASKGEVQVPEHKYLGHSREASEDALLLHFRKGHLKPVLEQIDA